MDTSGARVIASIHVVNYRRPTPAPPKRLAESVEGLRFWRPLNVGGDFHWHREHPSRWQLYRKMKPDFWRWAFMGIWEEEEALDRFLSESPVARSWAKGAREALHVWMKPTRVRGLWEAARSLEGSKYAGLPKSPAAYVTRLDLSLRTAATMWGSAAPSILAHIPDREALLLAIPLVDRPYLQPMTFTIWSSLDRALAFAYRDGHHGGAVERMQRTKPDLPDNHFSAVGFYPYRSTGSWNGRNPVNEAIPVSDGANHTAASAPGTGG